MKVNKALLGFLRVAMLCTLVFVLMVGCSSQSSGGSSTPSSGTTGNDDSSSNPNSSSSNNSQQKYVLKVGHVFAADHAWNIALEGLAEDVAEATNGNVEIQIYPSSQLGGDRDVAEGLQLGTVEMGLFGTGALQSIDKRLIVEELPYAWPTREHAYAAVDGDLGEALAEVLAGHGIVALSWWESGYRHITNSTRPINTPEDMQGIKLRVPEAELRIDTFKALGALPTPMAFSEVFYGLQQKVVDGQENPLATIYTSKFYEVQEHLALSGHIWGSAVLTISKNTWEELPEDYQNILAEKVEIWKEKEREMIRESDEEILADLEELGMQVTYPDVAAFQKQVELVWEQYESEFGKELIDIVRKYSSQ